MFSSFVSASTVFTPGAGTGSVVSYWGTMAGVTLGIILTTIAFLMFLVAIDIEQYEERMKVGKACLLLLYCCYGLFHGVSRMLSSLVAR